MSSPPIVHVCIRQTLDWQDKTAVEATLIPRFRQKYEAWNATFTLPYHVFRQRLKAIALLNFSRIDAAVCSSIDAVPPDHVLVPVDDDDWFSPDLAGTIAAASTDTTTAYLWTRATLQYDRPLTTLKRRVSGLIGRRDRHTCKTNNYAIRHASDRVALALNHVTASGYFDAHASTVRRLPETLGVQNRSLASQTSLAWGYPSITRHELVALLDNYRTLYTDWNPSPELQWAAPYVKLMAELMTEVLVLPRVPSRGPG